jgi:hypothetical protein
VSQKTIDVVLESFFISNIFRNLIMHTLESGGNSFFQECNTVIHAKKKLGGNQLDVIYDKKISDDVTVQLY